MFQLTGRNVRLALIEEVTLEFEPRNVLVASPATVISFPASGTTHFVVDFEVQEIEKQLLSHPRHAQLQHLHLFGQFGADAPSVRPELLFRQIPVETGTTALCEGLDVRLALGQTVLVI